MTRIALSGKMGSGKTHYAKIFQSAYGGERLSLATPIKSLWDNFEDREWSSKRHFCQLVGHGLREFDPDVWTRMFEDRLIEMDGEENIIVDDVRYPNEVELLEEYGFRVVRLVVSDSDRLKHLPPDLEVRYVVDGGELALDSYKFDYQFHHRYREEDEVIFLDFVRALKRGE